MTPLVTRQAPPLPLDLEIVGSVPWGAEGFPKQSLPGGTGKPLGRLTPNLLRASDGTAWLWLGDRLIGLDSQAALDVQASDAGQTIATLAPVGADFLAGSLTDQAIVLTKINRQGERARAMTIPLPAYAKLRAFALLQDGGTDATYLYLAGEENGQALLAKIDLQADATSVAATFDGFPPDKVWVLNNRLYWRAYRQDTGRHSWNVRDLASAEQTAIEDSPLHLLLTNVYAPLPDGGALMADFNPLQLVAMGADGAERQRWPVQALRPAGRTGPEWGLNIAKIIPETPTSVLCVGTDEERVYVVRMRFGS